MLLDRTLPNGEVINFHFVSLSYVRGIDPGTGDPILGTAVRLQSITNNYGYQLHYRYKANAIAGSGPLNTRVANWLSTESVTGVNNAIDYCGPTAATCSYSRNWPSITYVSAVGGPVTSATDQSSRTTNYSYTSGFLTGIRYPGSTSNDVTIAWNTTTARVTSIVGTFGTWSYAYSLGDLNGTTTASGPNGQSLIVGYSYSVGRPSYATNALGQSTLFQYDAQRRLTETALPEGNSISYTYDTRGNIVTTKYKAKFGSGLSDITTTASFPASCTNSKTCNKATSMTDGRGKTTDFTYDSAHGGLLTVTSPAPTTGATRPQVRVAYTAVFAYFKDASGTVVAAPTAVTLPTAISACMSGTAPTCLGTAAESRTLITYGSSGVANNLLPTIVTKSDGPGTLASASLMTYTANGDLTTIDGPLVGASDSIYYRFDDARQVIGMIGPDPDGTGPRPRRAQRLSYSSRGLLALSEVGTVLGLSDPDWAAFSSVQQVATAYDALGRPLSQRAQAGSVTYTLSQISYDASGRMECAAVRMNSATFGSPPASACSLSSPGGYGADRITQYNYDVLDRTSSVVSGFGSGSAVTTAVTYTTNGLPSDLTDGRGQVSIYSYDGFDRLQKTRFPNASGGGTSTTDYEQYTYDASSNLTSFRDRAGNTFSITYDALNRTTLLDAPSGTNDFIYTYDNSNNVLTAYSGGQTLTLTWDALGRRISEAGALGAVSYQYDPAGRPTRVTWPDTFYAQYDYDDYGGVTAVRENGASSGAGVLATYTYDSLGRRATATLGNGATMAWGYDPVGRLSSLNHDLAGTGGDLAIGLAYNPAGQIAGRTVSNPSSYAYTPTTGSSAYANNGKNQVTSAAGASVTYDARQNITAVGAATYGYNALGQLTSANPSGTAATLSYDPGGRLYQTAGASTTRFLYAGQQAIGEYSDSGALQKRYVPGIGLDNPIASYNGAGTGSRAWLMADERQSVTSASDGSGAVLSTNTYDEYGMPGANSGRFQYTGQMWLPETQTYHYRARAYAPGLGRFLQTDPIGYLAGQNLYGYVSADPVNRTDPMGTCPPCVGALVGGVFGAGVEAWTQVIVNGQITNWEAIAVQGAIGAVGRATGVGVTMALTRLVTPVVAVAVGGAIGNGFNSGASTAYRSAMYGGDAEKVFQDGAQAAATGAVTGAVVGGAITFIGGVAAQVGKIGASNITSTFSRPADGFAPLVQWQPGRFSLKELAAMMGSQITENNLTSAGDIYQYFQKWVHADQNCSATYVNGAVYTVCWYYIIP